MQSRTGSMDLGIINRYLGKRNRQYMADLSSTTSDTSIATTTTAGSAGSGHGEHDARDGYWVCNMKYHSHNRNSI